MASLKSRIKFNKVRNKGDKLKARIKREKKSKKKPKNKRKIWYYLLSLITFFAILVILALFAFATYIIMNAPEFKEEKLFNKDSTIIYDKDGEVLTTLGMNVGGNDMVEKRVAIEYDDLPEVFIDALIATEDSRFFQHNGVDLARFIKASIGQVLGQSDAGGASTLTMQVSKNALTDTTSTGIKGIIRKFTDIYLSVFKIEKSYTKQDILELYVNSEFLGNQSYGVEQASQTYFGKSAKDMSLSEAAMIAGLFQAPSAYDPYVYPEKAEGRRNQVLNLMVRHGYLSEEECKIAKSIPITEMLVEQRTNVNEYQGYIDTVINEVIDKYDINPYKVPIEIYTHFDKDKQDVINNIYNGNYGYEFKDDLVQLAVAVVDNNNGALLAVGAGRNKSGEMSYNYATMINRHPGSTIKPILDYGPAIEYLNYSTYTPKFDEEVSYSNGGIMGNWNNKYSGLVTMKAGLSKSLNTVALQVFQDTTNEQKWDFSNKLGVTPGNSNGKIYESASVGAFEGVNPVQLASAYSAFANGGYYTKAYTISKIVFKDSGDIIENSYTRERVMKATTSFLITDILLDVTASAAKVSGTEVATKTGTSSYDDAIIEQMGIKGDIIQDSWVATYNPDYTITFWYGYDELYKDHYNTMAATTTQRNKIHALLTKNIFNTGSKFTKPKGIKQVEIELETIPARLASKYTPKDLKEKHYFISGTEPTEESNRFTELDNVSNLKIVENQTKVTLNWEAANTPKAIDIDYLTDYFNTNYSEWASKYLDLRLQYNNNVLGAFGYDIYLQSGANLTYVGHTTDTTYTINDTTNYDSVVVKTAYTNFKDNCSSGVTAYLTGSSTTFKIELGAVPTSSGEHYINPTYKIGDTIPDIGLSTVKFLINGVDLTNTISDSDKKYTIKECTNTCKTVDKIDTSKEGYYQVIYTINYLGTPYKETRIIHIEK